MDNPKPIMKGSHLNTNQLLCTVTFIIPNPWNVACYGNCRGQQEADISATPHSNSFFQPHERWADASLECPGHAETLHALLFSKKMAPMAELAVPEEAWVGGSGRLQWTESRRLLTNKSHACPSRPDHDLPRFST
jgi:hypothetical protein